MAAADALQLSDGRSDGCIMGQTSADPIAFFGGTPAAQPTVATTAMTTMATTAATSTSPFGFSAAQGASIIAGINAHAAAIDALIAAVDGLNLTKPS